MLAGTDFAQRISKKNFKKQMPILKERLACLQKASWDAGLPIIVLLEGWDTNPKGGLIRSLTEPLDPRGFVFHAIRSPQAYEKSRPWMWRFWLKIPERGQWAIFDQSWYRRVLLERLQEKISERDLRRAFRDINNFERTLSDDGTLILKFFLHTEKAEFKSIASLAAHHSEAKPDGAVEPKNLARRYDQLLEIYEDTLRYTQTDFAPWIILPSSDKRTARVLFLNSVVKTLQERLGVPCKPTQSQAKSASSTKKMAAAEKSLPQPALIANLVDSPAEAAATSDQHPEKPLAGEDASQPDPEISVNPFTIPPDDLEAPDERLP
jgi:polyphosphate kinase 2 (PPK2 family)